MINALRRFFRNRGRQIFRYWDGSRIRYADPIVVWRAFLAHPDFEIERDSALIDLNEAGAWVRCIAATRAALGIALPENGGLTENETYARFQDFCTFAAALKKNINHWPTTSAVTGGIPTGMGQHWDPTPPPGSGSIFDEPNCAAPDTLPMASQPPSSPSPLLSAL